MATPGASEWDATAWLRVRWTLVGLVLCRGLVYLCVMPPFEGWDEYQHVGYVQHVRETGRAAVLGEAVVPPALLARVVEFPQSRGALEQIGRLGAVDYPTFWARGGPRGARPNHPGAGPAPVPLYQAQHGSLAYRLAAPLFAALGGVGDLRWSVGGLRLANLLLTAGAVWIALGALRRLATTARGAALVGLLIATQPLFLLNGVRVANDALGVLLATAAIAGALALDGRRLVAGGAVLGVAVGLAVAVKAVHLGLVPFVGACWLMIVARGEVSKGRALLGAAALALGCLAVTLPDLRWNLAHYGVPSPMQEAVKNRADGRTASDLLAAARSLDWRERLENLWLRSNLLAGGWSFLGTGLRWVQRYHHLAAACLLGWGWAAWARTRPRPAPFRSARPLIACLVLCLSYTAALAYHMAQSQLAWGVPTTNPWYACAALPWFLVLVGGGGLSWPVGRLRSALPILLAGTFVVSEGILVWGSMVPTYSGGAGWLEALRRLARLQPAPFGTATLLAAQAGALVLFAAALVLWARPGLLGTGRGFDALRGWRADRIPRGPSRAAVDAGSGATGSRRLRKRGAPRD